VSGFTCEKRERSSHSRSATARQTARLNRLPRGVVGEQSEQFEGKRRRPLSSFTTPARCLLAYLERTEAADSSHQPPHQLKRPFLSFSSSHRHLALQVDDNTVSRSRSNLERLPERSGDGQTSSDGCGEQCGRVSRRSERRGSWEEDSTSNDEGSSERRQERQQQCALPLQTTALTLRVFADIPLLFARSPHFPFLPPSYRLVQHDRSPLLQLPLGLPRGCPSRFQGRPVDAGSVFEPHPVRDA
jgi:hypothetical protein